MATTARDTTRSTTTTTTSGGPVKPQRGTSPSNTKTPSTHPNFKTPNITNTLKKSISTTSSNNSSSSDRKTRTQQSVPASASSSVKNVPNYLKSTAASRHDAYVPKKSDHDHNKQQQSNQSTLERRRSFDKPPSASRIAKATTSPGGAGSSRLPARSSSFSSRTTSTTATNHNANQNLFMKTPLAKSQQGFSSSKSLKSKSGITTTNKKKISTRSEVKDKHNVDNNTESNETDHEEDRSTVKSGGGDVLSVATSDDLNYEIDHEDNKTTTTTTDHESVGDFSECTVDREVEIENYDQGTDLDEIEGLAIESDLDESKINDIVDHEKVNGDNKEEVNVDNNEEESAINGGELEVNSETDKEIKLQHEEENNNNDNEEQAKESVDDTEVITDGGSSSSGKNHGKKESPVAYNDVIEETASKLLEKRKNKVKALVGAFETVIDYETAANSPHNNS